MRDLLVTKYPKRDFLLWINVLGALYIAVGYIIVLSNKVPCNRDCLVYQTLFSVIDVICNSNRW
jgi:hypothetical protein